LFMRKMTANLSLFLDKLVKEVPQPNTYNEHIKMFLLQGVSDRVSITLASDH